MLSANRRLLVIGTVVGVGLSLSGLAVASAAATRTKSTKRHKRTVTVRSESIRPTHVGEVLRAPLTARVTHFQWRRCSTAGSHCQRIVGATQYRYRVRQADVERTLDVAVTVFAGRGTRPVVGAPTAVSRPFTPSGDTATPQVGTTAPLPAAAPIVAPPAAALPNSVVTNAATVVGTAGEPNVACTTTLSPGANVQGALSSASPGSVVCLAAGSWSNQRINVTPAAPGLTLAAAPGATVSVAGINLDNQTNNLTIQGFHFTGSFLDGAGVNNVSVVHSNFENISGFAVDSYPRTETGNGLVDGFNVDFDQFDSVNTGVEIDGGLQEQANVDISHNVFGPNIGANGDADGHGIQVGGVTGLTVDNNAFVGPFNAQAIAAGAHNNALHVWGGESNVEVANNIMWHFDSRGQTVLVDEGPATNIDISNNLVVEDPLCQTYSVPGRCFAYSLGQWAYAHGLRMQNNTVVDPGYGGIMASASDASGGGFSSGSDYQVDHNIAVGAANSVQDSGDFSFGNCSTSCISVDNATDDLTGDTHWTPVWETTTWTPHDGSPWVAPPAGYYKPASGLASDFGYQGTIGP